MISTVSWSVNFLEIVNKLPPHMNGMKKKKKKPDVASAATSCSVLHYACLR